MTKNKTIIMIAHRLKTVRGADHILVLDKGKIVQWGSHEQLMARWRAVCRLYRHAGSGRRLEAGPEGA